MEKESTPFLTRFLHAVLWLLLAAAVAWAGFEGWRHHVVPTLAAREVATAGDEVVRAAQRAVEEGRYEEAAAMYRRLAAERPTETLIRFRLGVLLQDCLLDPAEAIGEFRACLALAPDAEKRALVEERLRTAKDQLARRFGAEEQTFDPAAASPIQIKRIEALEETIRARDAALLAATETEKKLRLELAKAKRSNDFMRRLAEGADANAPAPLRPTMKTIRVEKGDTLLSISRKVYGDESHVQAIREENGMEEGDLLLENRVLLLP